MASSASGRTGKVIMLKCDRGHSNLSRSGRDTPAERLGELVRIALVPVLAALLLGVAGCTVTPAGPAAVPGAAEPGAAVPGAAVPGAGAVAEPGVAPGAEPGAIPGAAAASGCPFSASDIAAAVEAPVEAAGPACAFGAGSATVLVGAGAAVSREQAESVFDKVTDLQQPGPGFIAFGDLSAQASASVGDRTCTVTLNGFEFTPERFEQIATTILGRCLT
jgi:hypothetical protein